MTEAEQNRLIIEHMHLVPATAADFRGGNVEFDDLLGVGREGLTKAARTFDETKSEFSTWAITKISSAIMDFVRSEARHHPEYDEEVPFGGDSIEKIYEWAGWGQRGNASAIAERWSMLDASPEELSILYEEVKDKRSKFEAAFMSLSGAQRKLVRWVYLNEPRTPITQAARDLGVSYSRAVRMLKRALKVMREVITRIESNQNSGGNSANGLHLPTSHHGLVPGNLVA